VPPDDDGSPGYKPRPPVLFWKLNADQLRKETDHLGAWVEQIFQPWYGHLATALATCWKEHPVVLIGLDILSELHSVLYCQPKRTAALLSAQAEYQTRIVPAFSEQFRAETTRCTHRTATASSGWAANK
jgi:hypothetical protein